MSAAKRKKKNRYTKSYTKKYTHTCMNTQMHKNTYSRRQICIKMHANTQVMAAPLGHGDGGAAIAGRKVKIIFTINQIPSLFITGKNINERR